MAMDQYLLINTIFSGLFTSILTQLWLDVNYRGTIGFDTLSNIIKPILYG